MRTLVTLAVTLLALGSVSTIAHADKYGTAGCGLGSILFDDEPGFVQVLAATSNWLFGTQTFGITSGTSNCEDTGGGAASAKAFVETNREAFAKDAARGTGETISSLSTLAGCTDAAAVGTTLQQSFPQIFPDASVPDTQVSQAVVDTLRAHPELSCKQLS